MKVTIYELLGMVKDGKAPKKIKYNDTEYYLYDRKSYLKTDNSRFFDSIYFKELTEEVEILEEEKKIPEKLDIVLLDQSDNWTRKYNKNLKDFENTHIELNPYVIDVIRQNTLEFQSKINEILDYLDYLKSKGDE